jgi:hypothetical protein
MDTEPIPYLSISYKWVLFASLPILIIILDRILINLNKSLKNEKSWI